MKTDANRSATYANIIHCTEKKIRLSVWLLPIFGSLFGQCLS